MDNEPVDSLQPSDIGNSTVTDTVVNLLQNDHKVNSGRMKHVLYNLRTFKLGIQNFTLSTQRAIQTGRGPNLVENTPQDIIEHGIRTGLIRPNVNILKDYKATSVSGQSEPVYGNEDNQTNALFEISAVLEKLGMLPQGENPNNFVQKLQQKKSVVCQNDKEREEAVKAAQNNGEIIIIRKITSDGKRTHLGDWAVGFQNQSLGLTGGFLMGTRGLELEFNTEKIVEIASKATTIQEWPPQPPATK